LDEFGCSSAHVAPDKVIVSSVVYINCIEAIEPKMEGDFDQCLQDTKEKMMKLGAQKIQARNHCEYIVRNSFELSLPN